VGDRRVLLVTGSRALRHAPAQRWAIARLLEQFAWLMESEDPLLIHGGCVESPDAWSSWIATQLDVRQRIYYASGKLAVWQGSGEATWRRWAEGAPPSPLDRNRYMIETVARKLQGLPLRVLALRAPWATTHGTEHTVTVARRAGLDVVEIVCPPECGPTEGR